MFTNRRINEQVRAALRRDPRIKHPELIATSVDEIGTEPAQSAAAAEDVASVSGVTEVTNRIEIR